MYVFPTFGTEQVVKSRGVLGAALDASSRPKGRDDDEAQDCFIDIGIKAVLLGCKLNCHTDAPRLKSWACQYHRISQPTISIVGKRATI
jgi:hypothetical protein